MQVPDDRQSTRPDGASPVGRRQRKPPAPVGALEEALRFSEQTGAVFIHPFDHPDIVAGQGTLGFEIIEQCPEVRTVVVSTGGGGFIAGIATASKSPRTEVRVGGVQADGGSDGLPHPEPDVAAIPDGARFLDRRFSAAGHRGSRVVG